MNTKILEKIDQEQKRKEALPEFRVGDSLRIHVKIKEGDKERVQLYSGTVIARDGEGANETFTVRRVSYGEGIERIFPINAPSIAKIEVEKSGKVRRAKLYYLRSRTGKNSKIAEDGAEQAEAKA